MRIQLILILEIKLRKEHVLAEYHRSFHFQPRLGWECTYLRHDLKNWKQVIYVKYSEYKTSN